MEANLKEIKKQIHDDDHRWYAISVVSGQESLVIENLQERVKKEWLWNDIVDFLSPMISETSLKKWEKVVKQKKIYPGYVFVRCRMNDKIWYVVRNTPGVRLIVWAETRPVPLTEREFNNIINQIKRSEERSELTIPYKIWDLVILKSGDFKWMQGKVKDLDTTEWNVIVNVEMLWRLTPVVIAADKIDLVG